MLLSDRHILEEVERERIIIKPFDQRQLGTNSYDVRLGEWYYVPAYARINNPELTSRPIDPFNKSQVLWYWGDQQKADHHIIVPAQTTILCHTHEVIGGVGGITTSMRCRSSFGRMGLSIAKCSGMGDVGFVSRWTMEATNHGYTPIMLPVGARIAQIEFYDVGPTLREYVGRGKYGQDAWVPQDMLPKLWLDYEVVDQKAGG